MGSHGDTLYVGSCRIISSSLLHKTYRFKALYKGPQKKAFSATLQVTLNHPKPKPQHQNSQGITNPTSLLDLLDPYGPCFAPSAFAVPYRILTKPQRQRFRYLLRKKALRYNPKHILIHIKKPNKGPEFLNQAPTSSYIPSWFPTETCSVLQSTTGNLSPNPKPYRHLALEALDPKPQAPI